VRDSLVVSLLLGRRECERQMRMIGKRIKRAETKRSAGIFGCNN
jgi:hypothetical protein